jgi:hypothetical protein
VKPAKPGAYADLYGRNVYWAAHVASVIHMSPALRPVREIMEKLDPKPKPAALSEAAGAGRTKLAVGEEAAEIV